MSVAPAPQALAQYGTMLCLIPLALLYFLLMLRQLLLGFVKPLMPKRFARLSAALASKDEAASEIWAAADSAAKSRLQRRPS